MKTKIFKFLSVLLVGLLLFGCSDDFLETKPIAQVSEESFYNTMEGADMATTACYSMFCQEKVWDLSILMTMGSIASDETEAGAGGKADVPEFQHVDQLRHTPSEPKILEWTWGYPYKTIGFCNIAIEKLPLISVETDPNFDAGIIEKRLGEARFLRALNYFTLTQMFGGVPLIDHILAPSEYKQGRSEIYEIINFIKSDLRIAIASLPERYEWGDQVGRASKGAAMALMAKTYLYESSYAHYYDNDERFTGLNEHWDSVLYWAEQVISLPDYKLVGIDGERYDTWRGPNTGGYQWLFMAEANNSEEEVFSIQSRQDDLGWFDSRGTALIRWCAPRKINLSTSGSDGTDFGWGWWCPTDFLVNSYEPGDPRYKATVLEETDSVLVPDGSVIAWRTPNYNILRTGTGLHRNQRKYECSPQEYWSVTSEWKEGPTNVKLIRLADVVLWASEAAMMTSQNNKALEYINMVRRRARNSGDNPDVLPDITGTVALDDIVQERLVELACEGHRFYDLVRWNLATQYLNHTLADDDIIIFESPKHDFFPIPVGEIALSGNRLTQYPGW